MKKVNKSLIASTLFISMFNMAYADKPGYISRNCDRLKESKTVSHWGDKYLNTRSYQVKKINIEPYYYWEIHNSNPEDRLVKTWHSRAGQNISHQDWKNQTYYPLVHGFHWWWNPETWDIERRDQGVSDCRSFIWGYNHW